MASKLHKRTNGFPWLSERLGTGLAVDAALSITIIIAAWIALMDILAVTGASASRR